MEKLIFELSVNGRKGYTLPACDVDVDADKALKPFIAKEAPAMPEVSESDVMRHYVRLSNLNYHVDKGFYPLGSCTMKYNPKVNEKTCALEGFADVHPYSADADMQGILELLYDFEKDYVKKNGVLKNEKRKKR